MKRVGWLMVALAVGVVGCAQQAPSTGPGEAGVVEPAVMEARYTAEPIEVDGKLEEPVWRQARSYSLRQPRDVDSPEGRCEEAGEVRFAWDERYFYLAVDFIDRDLQARGHEDGMHHYRYGDVAELFLKPQNSTWYWEMYVTPMGKQTCFFIPGRGLVGMEDLLQSHDVLKVAAHADGTINDWKDTDRGWTAEMAVPLSEITKMGDVFDPQTPWRVFVGRYNYGRHRQLDSGPEMSSAPRLPVVNWHLLEGYARLKLVK